MTGVAGGVSPSISPHAHPTQRDQASEVIGPDRATTVRLPKALRESDALFANRPSRLARQAGPERAAEADELFAIHTCRSVTVGRSHQDGQKALGCP